MNVRHEETHILESQNDNVRSTSQFGSRSKKLKVQIILLASLALLLICLIITLTFVVVGFNNDSSRAQDEWKAELDIIKLLDEARDRGDLEDAKTVVEEQSPTDEETSRWRKAALKSTEVIGGTSDLGQSLEKKPESIDAVVSACGKFTAFKRQAAIVFKKIENADIKKIRFYIYEKCKDPKKLEDQHYFNAQAYQNLIEDFPGSALAEVHLARLPNVGREFHTYAWHTYKHYDSLGDVVLFTPGSNKYESRFSFLEGVDLVDSLHAHSIPMYLPTSHNRYGVRQAGVMRNYVQNTYEGNQLEAASLKGLERWSRYHLGHFFTIWPLTAQGSLKTSRILLQQMPRETFGRVAHQLNSSNPEAGHYMERVAMQLFGGTGVEYPDRSMPGEPYVTARGIIIGGPN